MVFPNAPRTLSVASSTISFFRRRADQVSGTGGSLNIKLLISLIENSKIHGWESRPISITKFVGHKANQPDALVDFLAFWGLPSLLAAFLT
jgi:hypothetical protein